MISNSRSSIIGIGVDQGIANCGFSVIELLPDQTVRRLRSGTIVTDSKIPIHKRMALIHKLIVDLVDTFQPSIIGCEKLFFNPKQKITSDGKKGRNKSASILYTNMATGVLCLIAGQKGIQYQEFVPGTVKKYVAGSGRANKEDVETAVKHLLSTQESVTSHESDAVAIGVTAVRFYEEYGEVRVKTKPKKRRKKGEDKSE